MVFICVIVARTIRVDCFDSEWRVYIADSKMF